jgi:hypothetical protein
MQVVSLFLSPPCYLESHFLAKMSNLDLINVPKRKLFPCSILSQPELNHHSVVEKNVANFIETYHELERNSNHKDGSNQAENDAILVLYAASVVKGK